MKLVLKEYENYTEKELKTVENFIRKWNKKEEKKLQPYLDKKEQLPKEMIEDIELMIKMHVLIKKIRREMHMTE